MFFFKLWLWKPYLNALRWLLPWLNKQKPSTNTVTSFELITESQLLTCDWLPWLCFPLLRSEGFLSLLFPGPYLGQILVFQPDDDDDVESLLFCNLTLLPVSVKSLQVLLFSSGNFFPKCIMLSDVQHVWQCWIFEPLTLRAWWGPALSWIYYSLLCSSSFLSPYWEAIL